MQLSPLHARLVRSYKVKDKQSGNQHQGTFIDGERVVKSVRAKIIKAQKETHRSCYNTPSKDRAKPVIENALDSTPTTEAHRAVAAVMKKK